MRVASEEVDAEPIRGRDPTISVIIPARNEERTIASTLAAIDRARQQVGYHTVEVILVDNLSSDRTAEIVLRERAVQYLRCDRLKAPCARNRGAAHARGSIFVFVDADTLLPADGLQKCRELAATHEVGIFRIRGKGRGRRSRLWWFFWNHVRRLPLAHAKALPAFMFCTRRAFERYGPFDEQVVLGEEWPITAGCYRSEPRRFTYDRSICATTSNRRMDAQSFGYTRTFLKYVWAVLHRSGRIHYSDRIR